MKFIEAVGFICPDCQETPDIEGAAITEDGRISILGRCCNCEKVVSIDMEEVIVTLTKSVKRRAN